MTPCQIFDTIYWGLTCPCLLFLCICLFCLFSSVTESSPMFTGRVCLMFFFFFSSAKNLFETDDRPAIFCSCVCSMLSSKCLLSCWVCRCNFEWFMGLSRGCVKDIAMSFWTTNTFLCSFHLMAATWSLGPINLLVSFLLPHSRFRCVFFPFPHSWRKCADESWISLNRKLRRMVPLLGNINRYAE